jgi:hypothetical protein
VVVVVVVVVVEEDMMKGKGGTMRLKRSNVLFILIVNDLGERKPTPSTWKIIKMAVLPGNGTMKCSLQP